MAKAHVLQGNGGRNICRVDDCPASQLKRPLGKFQRENSCRLAGSLFHNDADDAVPQKTLGPEFIGAQFDLLLQDQRERCLTDGVAGQRLLLWPVDMQPHRRGQQHQRFIQIIDDLHTMRTAQMKFTLGHCAIGHDLGEISFHRGNFGKPALGLIDVIDGVRRHRNH